MKAIIDSWSVNQLGPALSTRREERDENGLVVACSYEAINEVTLRLTVIGNDGMDFVRSVQALTKGATLKGLEIADKGKNQAGRKYIFE